MATIAVVLLTIILVSRFARYARARRGDGWGHDGSQHSFGRVAELERRLEEQQAYVHSLEDRVMRLEEGLDFAERMLAERNG
jgi:hypothetical protein